MHSIALKLFCIYCRSVAMASKTSSTSLQKLKISTSAILPSYPRLWVLEAAAVYDSVYDSSSSVWLWRYRVFLSFTRWFIGWTSCFWSVVSFPHSSLLSFCVVFLLSFNTICVFTIIIIISILKFVVDFNFLAQNTLLCYWPYISIIRTNEEKLEKICVVYRGYCSSSF